MAILGEIIKGVIGLKDTLTPEANPIEEQKEVLIHLLENAKATAFGKHYKFSTLLQSKETLKDFSKTIPYFDYDKINTEWWSRLHTGEENITWPGTPDYYALSSGTTGTSSKKIPVTNDMMSAIRDAGIAQVAALVNFDLPAEFFEKGILMLGSSTDLTKKDQHLEGEISGISASKIPYWFRSYYKPGEEISQIEDWDERVQKISDQAKSWDIGALSGIPSWIELMLEKVIKDHNLKHIHEIWPNLQVYTSGGVAFGPYKKSFNALLGKPITVIDTYLASEGFIAFQTRPDTAAMRLATNNGIYFEFIPFEPKYIKSDGSLTDDAPSLNLSEVEINQDYALVMSTVSGAWRYLIGDTIEFTDVERAEIKITGRTKFFLNTVGSQLSVQKLDAAVNQLETIFDVKIPEYTLSAKRYNDDFYHSWYLGCDTRLDEEKVAEALDAYLKEANKNYKVARSKALKGVKVGLISPSVFQEWNARNKKKGGQVKMERVMGEDKFKEWEAFVSEN
jgi:hypothetical protein